jgi:hypothetical protein
MAAAGVLLLAKVLVEQGWGVEYEPEIGGVTPDLRIRKGQADFFVEAKHVLGDFEIPAAYGRIRAALSGIRTKTPANFSKVEVDGRASLKGFAAFMARALRDPRAGDQVYEEPGVDICFDLHLPPLEYELPVCLSYSSGALCFNDRPKLLAAIDEKLKKYPFPLVIATQSIGGVDIFMDAEDVLHGSQGYSFPVSHKTGGPAGEGRHIRMGDGATMRADSSGERARDRLLALLPFEVPINEHGFFVRARVLANPSGPEIPELREFLPIPSLLHIDATKMGYVGAGGVPLGKLDEGRDCFVP